MVRKNRRKNKFKNKDCDSDYEVIPKPEIRCLDENELEVKENHFVFGIDRNCNSPVDSDSDIEVLSKASSGNKGNWLYSQVLQKNLNEQGKSPEHSSCSEGCHEVCHALDESDLDFSENHFPNLKDSVDIVFSERVKEQTSSEIVTGWTWNSYEHYPVSEHWVPCTYFTFLWFFWALLLLSISIFSVGKLSIYAISECRKLKHFKMIRK